MLGAGDMGGLASRGEGDVEEIWEVRSDEFIDMMRRVRLGECGYGVGRILEMGRKSVGEAGSALDHSVRAKQHDVARVYELVFRRSEMAEMLNVAREFLGFSLLGGCWDGGGGLRVSGGRQTCGEVEDAGCHCHGLFDHLLCDEKGSHSQRGDGTWHSCLPSVAYCELVEMAKVRGWIKYQANGLHRSALVLTCHTGT